jgi:predicted ATPase/DNA-binding winged helix-turn-helix (wHTH) protein
LWREDQLLPLAPKPLAVLAYLVTHAGQVVTKDALLEAVWPKMAISEGVLKTCIGQIRQVLGETAPMSHYIATVRGRGYRFLAPVTALASSPAAPASAPPVPAQSQRPGLPLWPPGPLVGRASELAQLQQCWRQVCQGGRQVVCVTGEAGMGKTALVEAFVAQVRAAEAVWVGHGQCIEQYGAGEAYLPLLAALGQLGRSPERAPFLELLRQQAPSWLVQLPALLSPQEYEALYRYSSGTTRDRMLRELAEAVEALSAVRPLILLLEDLHWSDYATLDWLAYVARRPGPARLLLLGTYRPAEAVMRAHPIRTVTQELQRHRCCTELLLPYLAEAGVAAYLGHRFGPVRWPAGLVRLLCQRTSGNPLFLVTVVEELVRQEVLVPQGAGWRLGQGLEAVTRGVPESLVQLIDAQLRRLGPAEQELLRGASVAGAEFTAAALAAGLERSLEEVEAGCDALAHDGQFLRLQGATTWLDGTVTPRYRFVHELYREVLYERVSVSRRVRWHRQIGTRLEAGYVQQASELAAELAMHFVRGKEAPKAAYYLRLAGENALRLSAYQEALAHLQQGLAMLQTLPDTPERIQHELRLRMALGPALMATKGYVSADVAANYGRARELCQQEGDTFQSFPVLWGLWQFANGSAQHQTAWELGEQLLAVAQQSDDPVHILQAHHALWNTAFHRGMLVTAQRHLAQGQRLYTPQQHHAHAVQYAVDDPGVCCLSTGAQIQWLLGYPDQAEEMSRAGLALAQELGHPYSLAHALIDAATISQFRRDIRSVSERAEAVLALGNEHGFRIMVALGTILQGWAHAMQQPGAGIAEMRQGLADLYAMGTEHLQPWFRVLLVEACGHINLVDEGCTLLNDALRITHATGERVMEGELYRLQGELWLVRSTGQDAEAETCFQRALEVARQQQAKSLELRAAMSLGRLWQQQGKRAAAYEILAPTYGWFTEGFDTADVREAKALLDNLAACAQRTLPRRTKQTVPKRPSS